jgi:hypothetical protein
VAYKAAAGVLGRDLEATREWQYMKTNGKNDMFKGYIVSLDMYVRFCWRILGDLKAQVAILMVVEVCWLPVDGGRRGVCVCVCVCVAVTHAIGEQAGGNITSIICLVLNSCAALGLITA